MRKTRKEEPKDLFLSISSYYLMAPLLPLLLPIINYQYIVMTHYLEFVWHKTSNSINLDNNIYTKLADKIQIFF